MTNQKTRNVEDLQHIPPHPKSFEKISTQDNHTQQFTQSLITKDTLIFFKEEFLMTDKEKERTLVRRRSDVRRKSQHSTVV